MKYAMLLIISWALTGPLLAQTGSGNAFNQRSSFSGNPTSINGSFNFDLQMNGDINFQGRRFDFHYYINSRDGSMFFGPGGSSALTRWFLSSESEGHDIFQGAILHPGGFSVQYSEDPEDGTKHAGGVTFGAFPNNTDPAALQEFLSSARKSAGPNHPRFGPTTVYQKNMGGYAIKMTITNRGLNIPISPAAVGMMTPYFKDDNRQVNRLVTKFEMPGLTVSVSEFRRGSSAASFQGYEERTGRLDLPGVPADAPEDTATRHYIRRELAQLQTKLAELRSDKEEACPDSGDPRCPEIFDAWIGELNEKIEKLYGNNPWLQPTSSQASR